MAKDKKTANVQEPEKPVMMYTEAEVEEREDLMQKLMTLDHIKSVLVALGDSPVFIKHTEEIRTMVNNLAINYFQAKAGAQNAAANQQPEKTGEGDDGADGETSPQ